MCPTYGDLPGFMRGEEHDKTGETGRKEYIYQLYDAQSGTGLRSIPY